jgi:hypothetical protein
MLWYEFSIFLVKNYIAYTEEQFSLKIHTGNVIDMTTIIFMQTFAMMQFMYTYFSQMELTEFICTVC